MRRHIGSRGKHERDKHYKARLGLASKVGKETVFPKNIGALDED